MTDNHVHIGQFEDIYYDPLEIMDIVMSAGMEAMSFSTTSSCKDNILYSEIEKELALFLSHISYSAETIRPFFWYIPDYINQNITIENVFHTIPYKGIKLHPFAQDWNFDDIKQMEILHNLFDYAGRYDLPVLIHTGRSRIDSADRFECFICEYRNVKCILAHCRPLDVTIKMLSKYNNAFCDTAFATMAEIRKIIKAGFKGKIIFGSDFPITYFFRVKYPKPGENNTITLRGKYTEDIAGWGNFLSPSKSILQSFDFG
jgi:predicted TIM-barrel fold metal-dependent hydrolase